MADQIIERVDRLEERLAYQERTIEDLNATITEQWTELQRLARLLSRLESVQSDLAAALPDVPEPPPPHY